ncbi:carboxypeptidase regulatory-like domain-containing protein [Corallococcus terminator]
MVLRPPSRACWLLSFVLVTSAFAAERSEAGARVIAGLVVASTGPVVDVEVRATHEGRVVTARTDVHGHFVLRGLSDAGWTLTASRGAELGALSIPEETEDALSEVLEIGPPRVVRGIVRGASGEPLPGISVDASLQLPGGNLRSIEARTGGDGQFEVSMPGFSPIEIKVRVPGYLTRTVTQASSTDTLDIVLRRSETLLGVVTDSQGAPVKGVWVRLKRYGQEEYPPSCTGPAAWSASTKEDGAFAVTGLAPGRYAFQVSSPRHTSIGGDLELPSGAVRWVLQTGIRAAALVTGPDGKAPAPFSSAVTFRGPLLSTPDFIVTERTARVEAAGGATAEGLVPGAYSVSVGGKYGAGTWGLERKVQLSGGEPPIPLGVLGTQVLRMGLVDTRGRPVRGGFISLRQKGAQGDVLEMRREDLSGPVTLHGFEEGELHVFASAEGYEITDITVRVSGTAPHSIVMKRAKSPRVTGRVVDAKGRPIRSFLVGDTEVEHAGGRFSRPRELPGEVGEVAVQAKGFAPRLFSLDARRPESLRLGDVRLGPGRVLTGRVETPDGRGLVGVTVRCLWGDLPKREYVPECQGQTLPDGSLYLEHVPDERFELELSHPEWARMRLLIQEGVTHVQARLSVGLTVQGTVRDARGRPLEAGFIDAVQENGEQLFTFLGSDGTYTFHVRPGRGSIQVRYRESEPKTFEGAEGQTVRVDLVVPNGN